MRIALQTPPDDPFEAELLMLKNNVSCWIHNKLFEHLTWVVEFQPSSALNAFALMLHPNHWNLEVLCDIPAFPQAAVDRAMQQYHEALEAMLWDAQRNLFPDSHTEPQAPKRFAWMADTNSLAGGN